MQNYIQFELFLIILGRFNISRSPLLLQYVVNLTKTMKLNNLIQEVCINL